LSPPAFFVAHQTQISFSLAQFYRYKKAYAKAGIDGLTDGRSQGNHRRIPTEAQGFAVGYASAHPNATKREIRQAVEKQFSIQVSEPGFNQCLQRLGVTVKRAIPERSYVEEPASCAGFEVIVALAWHVGWPPWTASVIQKAIQRAKHSNRFALEPHQDLKGRRHGQFTAQYNRRRDVRQEKFKSIELKRQAHSLDSMAIAHVNEKTLARKCLAILTLPFITHNGQVRTVETPAGKALKNFCGFRYGQATLSKFLSELKYLGISADLLRQQVGFWQAALPDSLAVSAKGPLLCYYVDGNTKALWSKHRVKKNKVTMLGRVMGCLEQVFIHDSYGRPIYFETYSGHAPMGEYILSLFEKIEDSLEGPSGRLPVTRAIVMDGASNSVGTLRAFASQNKYHYITSLDDNQWDPRKVRQEGRPQRYRYGPATLRDCEIELKDSLEKGYLLLTRAIKIDWDRGKTTYLATSLPKQTIGTSQIVKSYFDRWPDEELPFKVMKAVGCLHRVAGYGKQKMVDVNVKNRQGELTAQIKKLRTQLQDPLAGIGEHECRIAKLIVKERKLRLQSKIVDGQRILPQKQSEELQAITREIARHKRQIHSIRKGHSAFKKLERAEREWIRLQGKEKVYQVDVELDQIMTFFRVSLVNLYIYLAHLMGRSHLSLVKLVYTVLSMNGHIWETSASRHITLERDEKDPVTMAALSDCLTKINALNIRNMAGKRMVFSLK
jgi:transposase